MSIDYEVAMAMQRICLGEERELTRGQIAGEVLDLQKLTKGFKQDRIDECEAFYNKLTQDDTKKLYDAEALVEETEAIKQEFDAFLSSYAGGETFQTLFDDISEFFMNPPFEGLDSIEYGVNEVCVFSVLEYFIWKTAEDHDHEQCRQEYRDSIAERTYEEVADHWIKVYDDLQKRYDQLGTGFDGEDALQKKIISCSIVAIAAIRDQDAFTLDMAQGSADQKAAEIFEAYQSEAYKEGESAFTDNAIRLFAFINGEIRH